VGRQASTVIERGSGARGDRGLLIQSPALPSSPTLLLSQSPHFLLSSYVVFETQVAGVGFLRVAAFIFISQPTKRSVGSLIHVYVFYVVRDCNFTVPGRSTFPEVAFTGGFSVALG